MRYILEFVDDRDRNRVWRRWGEEIFTSPRKAEEARKTAQAVADAYRTPLVIRIKSI
jgi:hypothetical protein